VCASPPLTAARPTSLLPSLRMTDARLPIIPSRVQLNFRAILQAVICETTTLLGLVCDGLVNNRRRSSCCSINDADDDGQVTRRPNDDETVGLARLGIQLVAVVKRSSILASKTATCRPTSTSCRPQQPWLASGNTTSFESRSTTNETVIY
jgi:hypothetical protein